jgi:hypothetical protein
MSGRFSFGWVDAILDRLAASPPPAGRPRRQRSRWLRIERLEDRQMLSGPGWSGFPGTVFNTAAHQARAVGGAGQASTSSTPASLATAAASYEADSSPAQAATILATGALQTHTLYAKGDADWVTFTLAQTSDVVIETRGTAGSTEMTLYSGQTVGGQLQLSQVQYNAHDGTGQFSRIICAGAGGTSLPAGHHALAAGTYYVKVDSPPAATFAPFSYSLSVTSLQPADVLLAQDTSGAEHVLALAIRIGEASQLQVPFSSTYYHSALYLGNDRVAEMLATGFTDQTTLEQFFSENIGVDEYRRVGIGQDGQAVVNAAEKYQGTPYAYSQLAVLAMAWLMPNDPARIEHSVVYATYLANAYGPQRMICSELVARAFAEAQTSDGRSLALSVTLWPAMSAIGNTSNDFLWDFTTPTTLSLSPSLQKLDA